MNIAPLLAATDLSAPARHAVDRAARLAREHGAPLHLLHVQAGDALHALRQWLGGGHALEAQLLAEARQQLQQLADEMHARHRITPQLVIASGSALQEMRRAAEALDVGLLVLGARGAGFLRRQVLGTTAERLLGCSARPLLLVRQRAHGPYRRVLVGLDFSPASKQALALVQRVAPQAQLVLLHAFQVPFAGKLSFAGVDAATIEIYRHQAGLEARQRVEALARGAGLASGRWQACIVEGDASLHIVEQEQEQDCDLVVLGKQGHSAVEDLLLGSVTRHVLAEGAGDVLVSTERAA